MPQDVGGRRVPGQSAGRHAVVVAGVLLLEAGRAPPEHELLVRRPGAHRLRRALVLAARLQRGEAAGGPVAHGRRAVAVERHGRVAGRSWHRRRSAFRVILARALAVAAHFAANTQHARH